MIPFKYFGLFLKARRDKLSVREAAKEIGISPSTISRVEGGQPPDLIGYGKICLWLKVSPGAFSLLEE